MNEPTLTEVLQEALLDEYRARNTYRKIIDTFGPVRPFINIADAEQRHIESLLTLFEKYNVPLPAVPGIEQIEIPDSLLKACEMGVDAEVGNLTMYDRLLAATDLPDVIHVLQRLQAASRDNHLPAFRRCVERGGPAGRGPGSARGHGGPSSGRRKPCRGAGRPPR